MDRKQKVKGDKQEMNFKMEQEIGQRREVEVYGQEAEEVGTKRREAKDEL
jgi:hypothetical protein